MLARRVHNSFTTVLLAAIAMLLAAASDLAFAQSTPPPPVRAALDGYGVDLTSGVLWTETPSISVGQAGAGGLSYSRVFDSGALAWRDNLTGTINSAGIVYTVTLFGASERFTLAGGVYVPNEPNGATLSFNAGANTYTYTTRGGAVAVYNKALAGTSPTQANEGRIVSFTLPTGETQTFTYVALNAATQRLQSLTNNFGYQIKFEYQNNDVATGGLTLVKVIAINNAVDDCSPTADTCGGFTQSWPSLTFNAAMPTEVTDTLGRVTRYTYTDGRISAIRRPSSASDNVAITYSLENGAVETVSDGAGTWSYVFTEPLNGLTFTFVTDPLNHTTQMRFNAGHGTLQSSIDALNRTTSFQYDSANRLTRATLPEGNYTQLAYDARGNVTTVTRVAKAGSGLSNIVTSAVYPASCANAVTCNLPTSTTDERGYRTDYTYNATHGGVETITAPAPSGSTPVGSGARPQTRLSYQQFNASMWVGDGLIVQTPVWRPVETSACQTQASCNGAADEVETVIGYRMGSIAVPSNIEAISATTRAGNASLSIASTFAYDHAGNLATVDGPLAGAADTTRVRYDVMRQVLGVIGPDPDGAGPLKHRAQRYSYNLDGQATSVETGTVNSPSDPDWAAFAALEQASVGYDAQGRRVRTSLIAGGATQAVAQFGYDAAGRLECAARRMNAAVFGALPSSACVLSSQGAAGPDRITRYGYTNADQVSTATSGYATPAPIVEATTAYTANALPATVTDGAGNVTTFVYDGFDRLSRQRYPLAAGGGSSASDYEEYSYNAASAVTAVRRRDGQQINFAYDNLARVASLDAPGTGDDVAYGYDLFSRTLSAAKGGQTLSFAYDALSRLTSASAPQGSVSYLYDAGSRRTRMTWPDGFYVAYDYDVSNAVTAIRENGAASGVGVLASFGYDDLGRRIALTRGNGVVTSYVYDAASRLQTLTQDLPGASFDQTYGYSYNAASQITQRTTTNAAYNAPAPVNGATNYTDNGLNQYTMVVSSTPTYDARGNLTSVAGSSYSYDVFNRLTSATPAGGTAATLAYDALGRLREVANTSATTRFLYDPGSGPGADGLDAIAEYNASNVLQRRYVHGPGMDEPLVWYEGVGTTDRRYLIADERGSVNRDQRRDQQRQRLRRVRNARRHEHRPFPIHRPDVARGSGRVSLQSARLLAPTGKIRADRSDRLRRRDEFLCLRRQRSHQLHRSAGAAGTR